MFDLSDKEFVDKLNIWISEFKFETGGKNFSELRERGDKLKELFDEAYLTFFEYSNSIIKNIDTSNELEKIAIQERYAYISEVMKNIARVQKNYRLTNAPEE